MMFLVLVIFVSAQLINGSENVNSVVQPMDGLADEFRQPRSLFHRHRHESSTESPFESATTKRHYFNIFHRRSTTTPSSEISTTQRERMRDKVRDFFRHSHSDDSTTTKKHYFDLFHRRSSTNSYAVTTPASFVITSTERQRMRDRARDFFRHSHSDDSTTTRKHYFDLFHRRSSTKSYGVTTPTYSKTKSTRKYRVDGRVRDFVRHSTASMINDDFITERSHRISKQKLKEVGKKYIPVVISAFKQHRKERKESSPSNVFYCYLQDANSLVIPDSVDDEGFGLCEFEGDVFTCPVEITCEIYHADSCCQDENGMPYCCKKPVRTNTPTQPPTAFESAMIITVLVMFLIFASVGLFVACRM